MVGWPPGTRHYEIDGGASYLAVQVDTSGPSPEMIAYVEQIFDDSTGIPRMPTNYITRPTTVLECDENGAAEHLTPLHTFPPLTQFDEAIALAGHTLKEN